MKNKSTCHVCILLLISFLVMNSCKKDTVQVPENDICPWIMITDHKNGIQSDNCIAANNIVSSSVSVSGHNVNALSNYVFGKANYDEIYKFFVDPDVFDMHLLINETTKDNIIDKGEFYPELVSSEIDKDNALRTLPVDIGAYEAR